VLDDFVTWDEDKYEFVREVLWQDQDGTFIGLDHVIALGQNGICLSDYSGLEAVPDLSSSEGTVSSDHSDVADPSLENDPAAAALNAGTPEGGSSSGTLVKVLLGTGIGILVIAGGFLFYKLGVNSSRKK